MDSPDREVSAEEQLALVAANLSTGLCVALASAGLFGPLGAMLDAFEQLNRSVLPPGHIADLMQMTVNTHREQLALALAENESGELDS